MSSSKTLTRKGRRAARQTVERVPGPSPNPATNLLIAEVAVRGAGRIARHAMEKGLLRARFKPEQATALVEGRGLTHTMITAAMARMATRSVPGALLVGGGLAAKIVLDRSLSRRKARRKGDKTIEQRAEHTDDKL